MVDYASVPYTNGGGSVVGSVLLEHDDWFNQTIAVGAGVTFTLSPRTVAMESPCGSPRLNSVSVQVLVGSLLILVFVFVLFRCCC